MSLKLKAPDGVGDPCVAGVTLAPRNGIYEVEAELGALLMECFGFTLAEAVPATAKPKPRAVAPRSRTSREP